MPTLTKYLASISSLRSSRSPGRRFVALMLCAMLILSAVSPGLAVASEADSEGEGVTLPTEAPNPEFDPGGEETALGEVPGTGLGEDESGPVEVEPELEAELPVPAEATGAATGVPAEVQVPPAGPEAVTQTPAPEPVQQATEEAAPATTEAVANQSIQGPTQPSVHRVNHPSSAEPSTEAPRPAAPDEGPRPTSPPPAAPPTSRDLVGKGVYVVQPGDCLWHIAASLLPAGADEARIENEVARLWQLNEDRIGTGDPSLIYAGTELLLR